jgi:catechol 2,3-dioxygenase-like lactoylglutathione lyase family enzyme
MRRLLIAASLLAAQAPPIRAAQPAPAPSAPQQDEIRQIARHHGVLIRVPDLDRARQFYVDLLGFEAERLSDTMLRLPDPTPIYLEQVAQPLRPPAEDEARAAIAFQARDIRVTAARLRERGVTFLSEEPIRVGVGLAMRFRDPFGNIHALLEQTAAPVPPFEEPEVYNSGFKIPDADTAALRDLFAGLGIMVRTERYYPPSLPLGHRDGSFAFMLHENEQGEPEVRARIQPESAAVSLVLATASLDGLRSRLTDAEIGDEGSFALGRRVRVTAPSGVSVEFWQLAVEPAR